MSKLIRKVRRNLPASKMRHAIERETAPPQLQPDHGETHERGGYFGDQRSKADAVRSHAEAQHEQCIERHVADVEVELENECQAGPGLSDQPAQHHEIDERERR